MSATPATAPDPDEFATWQKAHPWPELQDLIDRFGGYNRITAESWAEYAAAVEAWQPLARRG